jgi:hypothetical protein
MSPPPDATEEEQVGLSQPDPQEGEGGSLLPVTHLPTPPGVTVEELQSDLRSSDEEELGVGETRPAQRPTDTSVIDLTMPDDEAGELPQEPPVAADGGGVHPGEGWFENRHGCVHMEI